MSYDIRFGVKVEGAKDVYAIIGRPEYDSPTYNNRNIFVHSMGWDYHQGEWYPMNEVIPKVEHGIHELTFNEKEYKKYDPDNGLERNGPNFKSQNAEGNWSKICVLLWPACNP